MSKGIYLHKKLSEETKKKISISLIGNRRRSNLSLAERFWRKVKIDDLFSCWEWQGSVFHTGYGYIKVNKKNTVAHRVAWELCNGIIPDDKLVLHKCDNRKCCNPAHLFLGNQSDNMKDMILKGRGNKAFGERGGMTVLNEVQVNEILILLKQGFNTTEIGKKYNVSHGAIWGIKAGVNWKHISR